jgi:hypothetical protein
MINPTLSYLKTAVMPTGKQTSMETWIGLAVFGSGNPLMPE